MGSKIKHLVAAFLSITIMKNSKKKFSTASNKYFNQRIFHFLTTARVHFCGETVNAHEYDCTVALAFVKTSRPQQIPMNVRFTTVYLSVTQGFVSSRPAQFSLVKPYSSWINARMPEPSLQKNRQKVAPYFVGGLCGGLYVLTVVDTISES